MTSAVNDDNIQHNNYTTQCNVYVARTMNQAEDHQQQSSAAITGNDAGQPVTITLPPSSTTYELYKSRQSKIAGLILIIIGVICFKIGVFFRLSGILTAPGLGCGILVSRNYTVICFYTYTPCPEKTAP